MKTLNKYIDHTLLKPEAKREEIIEICKEAKEYDFMSVCINPNWISLVKEQLEDSDVNVCTVIGFPLGANNKETKALEAKIAVEDGADEVDMVLNIGRLKSKDYDYVKKDIEGVVRASGDKLVKVIIETSLLTDEEKVKACKIAMEAGAHYVKTSTGFSNGGAKVEDIKLMRDTVGDKLGVKASGGVRTYEDALKFIDAGASRLGASSGVNIIKEEKAANK